MTDNLSSFELASTKLSDSLKLAVEAHELIMADLEQVRQEKAAFKATTKPLNDVHFGKTVKLNVRGLDIQDNTQHSSKGPRFYAECDVFRSVRVKTRRRRWRLFYISQWRTLRVSHFG